MPWISEHNNRDDIIATVPGIAEPFKRLYASFWQLPQIPAETLELCRLRLAQLNRSSLDGNLAEVPISADKRNSVANWVNNSLFTKGEQASLAFTEVYAMDPQAITDELADDVKTHYGDAGLVALVEALGIFNGLARLSLLWELEDNNNG